MNQREQYECFERWLAPHAGILHRVANGFADGADRDDLRQELLLAVWKAIPAFREDAQAATFIYRVAHNAALTWHRTQRNYRRKVERLENFAAPEVHPPAGGERELLEGLYAEIRTLPPVDRSLILLSLDGVSYREMAAMHGLSESNVGVRLNRIKEKLSANMKGIAHEIR